ncbi:carbohydrate kinase family protein [Cohnella sp. REN36]|uniref:carbohydrate kinase family protein n=1 Tax=Cohnella sp. REN36 TaxID=2887347 RepID=UPI001D158FC0|nr:carbohydrate kinase family protein [Cohnella sp. REN36]MCC3372328.1 carbohydrate kinase family protein [Cohnella sp. REN36]
MPETIVGVGDLTVDIMLPQVDRFPEWGQETIISEPWRKLGGNIGNMAIGIAALKGKFIFHCMIGEDEEGRFIRKQIVKNNLLSDGLIIQKEDGGGTSQTYACIRKDGERLFLTYPGVLELMEVLIMNYPLPPGKIVFLSGWCLPPRVRKSIIIEKIKSWQHEGRWVAVDLIWSDESWRLKNDVIEVIRCCNAIFMNEDELLAITGEGNVVEGVNLLKKFMVSEGKGQSDPLIIIKQGKRGAVAFSNEDLQSVTALPVETESTVGAGDLFNAAFLHALWNKGYPVLKCLQFACTFAGLSIDKSSPGLPGEREVEQFLKATSSNETA